jgi:hypothetical protein
MWNQCANESDRIDDARRTGSVPLHRLKNPAPRRLAPAQAVQLVHSAAIHHELPGQTDGQPTPDPFRFAAMEGEVPTSCKKVGTKLQIPSIENVCNTFGPSIPTPDLNRSCESG